MCEFCNLKSDEVSNLIKRKSRSLEVNLVHYEDADYENWHIELFGSDTKNYLGSIGINYCPVCGRKLENRKPIWEID